jgi:hypothetical protein
MAEMKLPTWDEMSDLDKGAALLHLRKVTTEGKGYATENYPAEYFDHSALTALDEKTASRHARGLFARGDYEAFEVLGEDEYARLYDAALDADRKN